MVYRSIVIKLQPRSAQPIFLSKTNLTFDLSEEVLKPDVFIGKPPLKFLLSKVTGLESIPTILSKSDFAKEVFPNNFCKIALFKFSGIFQHDMQ